ncbi:carbohydrate sulfotransferase 4 [Platysternon megacephalum]|uniref:Carbohydrate sulfotransferase 4 n=1 Tax=Platysternon megacephalum TaxID=55544 RepID=A0A4D9E3J5_9SAUR|nr:carbohydrate sulfotransferase 4 [Platysternon megacephalum]
MGDRRWGKQPGQLQSPQLSCSFYRASSLPTCPPPAACGGINLRSTHNTGQGGRQVLLCPRDGLFCAVPCHTQHTMTVRTYCIHTTLQQSDIEQATGCPSDGLFGWSQAVTHSVLYTQSSGRSRTKPWPPQLSLCCRALATGSVAETAGSRGQIYILMQRRHKWEVGSVDQKAPHPSREERKGGPVLAAPTRSPARP